MSFFGKFKNSSNKAKDSKKGWEPPKVLPPAKTESPNSSIQTQEAKSGFDFITEDTTPETQRDTSFSFLDAEGDEHVAGEFSSTEAKQESQFSFLSEQTVTQPEKDVAEDSSEKSAAGDDTKAATTVKKKVEVTPRKKKKKVIQPGYGKITETPSTNMMQKSRSLSSTSASESRSEGSVGSDMMKMDVTQEVECSSSQPCDEHDSHKGSVCNQDSSAFTFLSSSDVASTEEAGYDSTKEDTLGAIEVSQGGVVGDEGGRDRVAKDVDSRRNEYKGELPGDDGAGELGDKDMESTGEKEDENSLQVDSASLLGTSSEGRDVNKEIGCGSPSDSNQEVDDEGRVSVHQVTGAKNSEIVLDVTMNKEGIEMPRESNEQELPGTVKESALNELKDALDQSQREGSSYELALDAEEKTQLYLQTLASREHLVREQLDSLRDAHAELLRDLKDTTFCKEYLVSHISQLQEQQQVAIKKDDFSLAESINSQLEEKQRDVELLKYRHPLLEKRVIQLFEKSNQTIESNRQDCDRLECEFEEIIATERQSLDEKVATNDNSLYKARLVLDEEKTKLDREMGHIALDREHLSKGKLKLDNEIMDRTREKQEEKVMLTEERDNIRAEIKELEIKLEALRMKEASFNVHIEKVDLSIQEMTKDFLPQKERLAKEEQEIRAKEAETSSKLQLLEKNCSDLKQRQEREEKFEKRCKENIEVLSTKIASLNQLKEIMEENVIHMNDIIDKDLLCFSPSQEHRSVSENLAKLTEELSTARYKEIDYGVQLTRMKKRLDDIEARVEELEKKKQIAASARNFKAAKSIIEERNKILNDGKELQEQVGIMEVEKNELSLSIKELNCKISQAKEEISSTENELDKNISSSLVKAIYILQEYVSKSKPDSWIVPILQFEVQICKDIVRDIHSKYGWPKPEIAEAEPCCANSGASISDERSNPQELPDDRDDFQTKESEEIEVDKELRAEIEELEYKLLEAVEHDNFDEADELNTQIEERKKRLKSS